MVVNETQETEQSIFTLLKQAFLNIRILVGKWYVLAPLLLVYIITVVAEPYFYKVFIDTLDSALSGKNSISAVSWHLGYISIGWIVLVLVSLASFTVYDFLVNTYVNRDWEISMQKVSAHMLRLPIEYHLKVNIGERQKLVERGNDALWNVAWNIYIQIVPSIFVFISLLVMGFYINPILTLVSLSILPVGIIISATIGAKAHRKQKEASNLWDAVYGRFADALVNLPFIRILAKENTE